MLITDCPPLSPSIIPRLVLKRNEQATHWSDITREKLEEVKLRASSVHNFAAKLVEMMVPKEIRKRSNSRGVKGKQSLGSVVLDQVRNACKELYDVRPELIDTIWRSCIKAIDESCRRLNRQNRSNNSTCSNENVDN